MRFAVTCQAPLSPTATFWTWWWVYGWGWWWGACPPPVSGGHLARRVLAPSLPTIGYAGGNVKSLTVEDIWNTRPGDVARAVRGLQAVHDRNVFPTMNVTFGSYLNNIGHMDSPVDTTYLADNVILFRYFEAAGRVRRAISVLKKRSGSQRKYGSSWKPIHMRGAALAATGATRARTRVRIVRRKRRLMAVSVLPRSDDRTGGNVASRGSDFVRVSSG